SVGGGFQVVRGLESGLSLRGDVRSLAWLATADGPLLAVGNNNAELQVLSVINHGESALVTRE
ncbi:MAG: hypothetical protein R3284_11520, partial [Rubricoccaceae bacterium]|nr:hypothetical protein [Rubricoccaceae bacterium]